MNKRQKKKRSKIIINRIVFFRHHLLYYGRRNGKTHRLNEITKAIYSKKYKPFNELKKRYENLIVAIDYSNGKDYSVKTTAKKIGGKMEILKVEVIE